MARPMRRVVTGHNAQGKSVILSDGPSPHALELDGMPGLALINLWVTDGAPASNADIGKTIARLLALNIPAKGKLVGRELTEATPNGAMPESHATTLRSEPDAAGHVTVVLTQTVGDTVYFDAAGYPGRTLGLSPDAGQ